MAACLIWRHVVYCSVLLRALCALRSTLRIHLGTGFQWSPQIHQFRDASPLAVRAQWGTSQGMRPGLAIRYDDRPEVRLDTKHAPFVCPDLSRSGPGIRSTIQHGSVELYHLDLSGGETLGLGRDAFGKRRLAHDDLAAGMAPRQPRPDGQDFR